ncbi:hydrogenase maturation protease [Microbispora hainanensis]|uniref:Hydrogenase maturation protease n=1 Tax=Microbispora hainanensis TaxID=568844 RepID=A0A544YQF6_9ACTN|nr:hydrogenase maturation protease [Microbispora hainanensis]TQS19009.1 hydrogenase maturation protease [Microbispora hainanensis]
MRTLVAGVGNVFLGDDGFGVAVARRLSATGVPDGVEVGDFGIRGIHLAYELTSGYDLTILVDAAPSGRAPGTLSVVEPASSDAGPTFVDAHAMTPEAVLTLVSGLDLPWGGKVLLVGCEPADVTPGMDLSPPVAAAVPKAADLVLALITKEFAKEARGC